MGFPLPFQTFQITNYSLLNKSNSNSGQTIVTQRVQISRTRILLSFCGVVSWLLFRFRCCIIPSSSSNIKAKPTIKCKLDNYRLSCQWLRGPPFPFRWCVITLCNHTSGDCRKRVLFTTLEIFQHWENTAGRSKNVNILMTSENVYQKTYNPENIQCSKIYLVVEFVALCLDRLVIKN